MQSFTKDPWTDAFSNCADGATLACRVATFKYHNDTQSFVFDPILKFAELCLELGQFLHTDG
jgi:hypothetical protein